MFFLVLLMLYMQFFTSVALEEDCVGHLQQQAFPDICEEFISQEQWDRLTANYCGQSELTYHTQRKDGKCGIRACLPPTTCQAGEIPILHECHKDDDRYAYIKCQPCPDNSTFEPDPQISYKYRDPTCRDTHQTCWEPQGKVLVRAGNSTHDTRCRCLWEKGFSVKPAHCTSPEGFENEVCDCYKCPDHMQVNQDFKCVKSTTEDPPESTTKDVQTMETSQSTPSKTADTSEEVPVPGLQGVGLWLYLAGLVLVLLLPAIYLMLNYHP